MLVSFNFEIFYTVLAELWFCSDECSRKGTHYKGLDHVQEYSKSFTWHGLNLLVRHAAIRAGNGPAIMDHWSLDFVQFLTMNHPNYAKLTHQLLAGKSMRYFCLL